jgi:hypothetical protein
VTSDCSKSLPFDDGPTRICGTWGLSESVTESAVEPKKKKKVGSDIFDPSFTDYDLHFDFVTIGARS